MSAVDFWDKAEILDNNWDKVIGEYEKRSEGVSSIIKDSPVVGIVINVLFLILITIHYILYKLQLPYEIIGFSLISVWSLYTIYKHMAIQALQYQDISSNTKTNVYKSISSISSISSITPESLKMPKEPTNEFYTRFVGQLKFVGLSLGVAIILFSLFIHFFLGGLIINTGVMFTFVFVLLVAQQIHLGIKITNSVIERDSQIGFDMLDLAAEMKEDGKI